MRLEPNPGGTLKRLAQSAGRFYLRFDCSATARHDRIVGQDLVAAE